MEEGGRNAYSHLTCQNPQRLIPEVCLVTSLSAFRWSLGIRLASPKATAASTRATLLPVTSEVHYSLFLWPHRPLDPSACIYTARNLPTYLNIFMWLNFFFLLYKMSVNKLAPGETDWCACARQSSLCIVKERLGCVKGLLLPKLYKMIISLVQVCRCQESTQNVQLQNPSGKSKEIERKIRLWVRFSLR